MAFYENTIVIRQDLAEKEVKGIKDKYNDIINKSSGKVIKVEEWGLLGLANKIYNFIFLSGIPFDPDLAGIIHNIFIIKSIIFILNIKNLLN